MLCQAKITDEFGGKYQCMNESTVRITIIKAKKHSKCLCTLHRHRYVSRYRYEAKHCHKPCEIIEEQLIQQ